MISIWVVLTDIASRVLHFLPAIMLAMPVQIWAFFELRSEKQWRNLMGVVAAVVMLVGGLVLAAHIPGVMQHDWTPVRLVPAIAWSKGLQLYYPPDHGPVFVQMYGPVSAMVYLPAALMSRPTTAILVATLVNTAMFILPAGWFFYSSRRGQSGVVIIAAVAGFLLLSLRQFVLLEAATRVTIDSPAVGFAACAFAMLVGGRLRNPWRIGATCGLFVALSIWTKPTLFPIMIALLIYAAMILKPADALRFATAMAGGVVMISAILVLWFGQEMLFQMLELPLRQPWQWPEMDRRAAFARAAGWIWRYARPIGWMAPFWIALAAALSTAGGGGLRQWARQTPWLLPLIAAVVVVPTATLAYVKVGGAWNNAVVVTYFLLLAAVSALSGACKFQTGIVSARSRLAYLLLATVLLTNCRVSKYNFDDILNGLGSWPDLQNNEQEAAFAYAKKHAGQIYFPSHPLAVLLAEGRLDHIEAGFFDRNTAGMPVAETQLREWLPREMKMIAMLKQRRASVVDRLPEYSNQIAIPELPDWIGLTQDGHLPP